MNPVDEAINSRRCVRAFLPTPVSGETIRHILAVAARAPSGNNTQPWMVYVVQGAVKDQLSSTILEARTAASDGSASEEHKAEYRYYSGGWREPYLSRRRKIGWDLYGLIGVKRGDRAGSRRQHDRNFVFFDAPVGMIFTIDRDLEKGSWLDLGMFIENVMIAARGQGLHTCPQAAFMDYHKIIRAALGIPDGQIVVCGMSIGYEDSTKSENALRTEREPVDGFVRFYGF